MNFYQAALFYQSSNTACSFCQERKKNNLSFSELNGILSIMHNCKGGIYEETKIAIVYDVVFSSIWTL